MNAHKQIGHKRLLQEERFIHIFHELSEWRIDPFIRQLETGRKKGGRFPFARGLRLSAQLIYAVREILSGTNLTANWGQLIDERGISCSNECDVIIHRKGHIRQWNGDNEPVMDFKFIEQQNAIAIISCKSFLKSGNIEKQYCALMKPFVKKVWLFAECCEPRNIDRIRANTLKFGYERFWYLYSWSKNTAPQPNKEGWNEFVEEVEKFKKGIV